MSSFTFYHKMSIYEMIDGKYVATKLVQAIHAWKNNDSLEGSIFHQHVILPSTACEMNLETG